MNNVIALERKVESTKLVCFFFSSHLSFFLFTLGLTSIQTSDKFTWDDTFGVVNIRILNSWSYKKTPRNKGEGDEGRGERDMEPDKENL